METKKKKKLNLYKWWKRCNKSCCENVISVLWVIRKFLFFPHKALFYKTGIKSKEIRNITGCENENVCTVLLCPFFHYCHLLNVCDSNNPEFGLSFATESAVLGTPFTVWWHLWPLCYPWLCSQWLHQLSPSDRWKKRTQMIENP